MMEFGSGNRTEVKFTIVLQIKLEMLITSCSFCGVTGRELTFQINDLSSDFGSGCLIIMPDVISLQPCAPPAVMLVTGLLV